MAESHSAPRSVAGVLGLAVAVLACQVPFYLNKPDVLMILDSNPQRFLIKRLQSVAAGLILTMLLSWIFPGLFHGYGQALGAAVLAISSRVILRPLVRMLVKHKKIV